MDFPDTFSIYLEEPIGSESLLNCHRHPRELSRLDVFSKDTEVELEIDESEDGMKVTCKNGIVITHEQIGGYFVLSPEARLREYAEMKFYLDRLSKIDASFYKKCLTQLHGRLTEISLSELYVVCSSVYNNPITNFLSRTFSDENIEEYRGEPMGEERAKVFKKPIRELRDEEYIQIAALHLFGLFAGRALWIVTKGDPLFHPLARQLFGQQLWWLIHLVSPSMNSRYTSIIAQRVRPNMISCSAFHHNGGEDFAIDYWQAWVLASEIYLSSFGRWYEKNQEGSESVLETMKSIGAQDDELKFISKYASYVLSEHVAIIPEYNTHVSEMLDIEPLTLVFVKAALLLEKFQK